MGAPLSFTSARRIARTLKRAVAGWSLETNSRRNVASRLLNQCARASTAAGNAIHSARLSPGKKLIAGSCHANHASIDVATLANTVIQIARCHGLETNIATKRLASFWRYARVCRREKELDSQTK